MRGRLLFLVLVFLLGQMAAMGAWAGSCLLIGSSELALVIAGGAQIYKTPDEGVFVQGTIQLYPRQPLPQSLNSIYFLDEQPLLVSTNVQPQITINTAELSAGRHSIRLEALSGAQLAMSSGNIPLYVSKEALTNALFGQLSSSLSPLRNNNRKFASRALVYFDNKEADLEQRGILQQGRIYITLTDLIRHIGGSIAWGPSGKYVIVQKNDIKVKIIPDSVRIYVNGQPRHLDRSTFRQDNRLYVPIRPLLAVFGLAPDWNPVVRRAYVNTK